VNEITPLLNGVAQAALTVDDVSFLSGETGFDATWITLLAESARRNVQANTIPQSAFYGLFRQGLPTDLEELLENEISLLRAALESSSNEAIIPQLSSAQLDQIADNLRILKASLLLQPGAPGETSSLGDLLGTSELTVDKRQTVAGLLVQHGGATPGFWDAIDSTGWAPKDKNDVRFTLQVGDLTTNHLPLVRELRKGVDLTQNGASTTTVSNSPTWLRPFAVKGVAEWKALLEQRVPPLTGPPIGAPPTIPGATLPEKINNYAVALNAYMEDALPTPVIAGRVASDTAGDSPFNSVRTDLQTFFRNNKSYEFREIPISQRRSRWKT
jgi:hypothetical protein